MVLFLSLGIAMACGSIFDEAAPEPTREETPADEPGVSISSYDYLGCWFDNPWGHSDGSESWDNGTLKANREVEDEGLAYMRHWIEVEWSAAAASSPRPSNR